MENVGNNHRNNESGFGMDVSNEFQEDIDFAAYLKLDQHISGTLMGEEVSRTNLSGKMASSSKDNNGHPPNNNHLKDLPPSQIVGEDGKLEKVHRCPDCSKMFTNNINLRRHYKLKHERNQIFQSAEPVSMVVEKFKIMDGAVGKEGEKIEQGVDCSNIAAKATNNNLTIKDQNDAYHQNKDEKPAEEDTSASIDTSSKNDDKVGKLSKLSSIVQRLASKISAGQSTASDGEVSLVSAQDRQPITQLEELGDSIFGQPAIKSDATSPKRNKRKPTNVHHVPIKESAKEIMQDEVKHKSILPDKYKQQQKLHQRQHQNMSQHDRPTTSVGGIYRQIFESGNHSRHPVDHLKMHAYDEYLKDRMHTATTPHTLESGLRSRNANKTDSHVKEATDLSKIGISHPRDIMMSSERRYPQSSMPQKRDASRMETFLSQCFSSKKCDIPQNAVLDKNLPIRDSHAMTKKLKNNMKNLSNTRMNEHLPPSAYFSQRDRVFSPGPQKEQSTDHNRLEQKHSTDSEAPLDLRIPSKKSAQDYVVRDDGVLDFSQKTRNSLGQSKQKPDSPNMSSPPDHPRVKIEPGRNIPVYPDRRYNEPYSRQYAEDVPPWLQSSHHKFLSQGRLEQHMNPLMDNRRDLLHGRPTTSKSHKPYKFHCMDYKTPYRDPSSLMDRNPRMSRPPSSYRDHPYLPMYPGQSGITMGRRRYTPPHMYAPQKEDSRRYSSEKVMPSRMMHKHYPQSSQYRGGNIPVPRYPPQSRDGLPSYPGQSSSKNWQRDHRDHRESHSSHADQSTPPTNNLRHILPKGGWKNDVISKSVWKEEPRPIPSSIQRLALKRAQRASPFDRWDIFDDRDMMNRCIKKAQQSLKKEPASENLKQNKDEIFNRDPIAFKESPNMPDYLKKLEDEKLMSRSLTPGKIFVTTSSPMQTRSPPFTQPSSTARMNPPMPHTKDDAGIEMYGMLNLSSPMKSHQPYEDDNEQEHETRTKESLGQVNEVSQEDVGEREKLTMTPGLESSHDTTELSTNKTDDDCDEITDADLTQENTDNATAASNEFPTNERDVSKDLTSDIDEIHSMRPAFVDSRQSSGKVLCRRHTHAHPGDDSFSSGDIDETLNGQKRGLKRSCSNDSNQCESLSDEGDGSSRKLIKKLKLRVIKSPGSEHKKYWTLVDQDRPPLMNTLDSVSDLPTSNERHEKQIESCKDGNEETSSKLLEVKEDDSQGAEVPRDYEQEDLTSPTNDAHQSERTNSESTTPDDLVLDEVEAVRDEAVESLGRVCSTNDEATNDSTNTDVTESQVETMLVSTDNIEVKDTSNIDEDEKCDETESINPEEAISKSNDDTCDIQTSLATTESSHVDEDLSDTAKHDSSLPDVDTDTVMKEIINTVDSETETLTDTNNSFSTQSVTSDPLPIISTKGPESNVKIAELPQRSNVPPPPRTTRSGTLSTLAARSDKKLSIANTNAKKSEGASAEPSSSRLRRSVRIRKTSSDKDAVAKKKK